MPNRRTAFLYLAGLVTAGLAAAGVGTGLGAAIGSPRNDSTTPGAGSAQPASEGERIRITASSKTGIEGGAVLLTATARDRDGRALSGEEIVPYLNGRDWGAPARTDTRGVATLTIPLPRPGLAVITAAIHPTRPVAAGNWIWASSTSDGQVVDFVRRFTLTGVPTRAVLRITGDDSFNAYLNGHLAAVGGDFHEVKVVPGAGQWLRSGRNILAVEGRNGTGPAGLLASLQMDGPAGHETIVTDTRWMTHSSQPRGWPAAPVGGGMAATIIAPAGEGVWGSSIRGWPGLSPRTDFPVGTPVPPGVPLSNPVSVRVKSRMFHVERDPAHRVGMEWEPWFTPLNARWDTAEAIPIVGKYDSFNTDVIRQHCLWMASAGIDFLLVDWSNNLWDKKHFSERAPGVDELIRATTAMLDTYAALKREGVPVPQVTLLLGLDNGPATTPQAIDEEMRWVYQHYVSNPRYAGLWLYEDGKPLIVPFDGGGQAAEASPPLPLDPRFTVRWMGSQLDANHLNRRGYWSWMDGVIHPVPTIRGGKTEALTVTPAFFSDGGWTYPKARGRRGGATYVEEFTTALADRPQFLLINQWNEFAGQPVGGGYGPKHDQYVDTYNVPLSDDIEPVSLTDCGYRGCGGWGFYYLNMTRALIDLYRHPASRSVVLAVSSPERDATVAGDTLKVEWSAAGDAPDRYTIMIDGQRVTSGVRSSPYSLSVRGLRPGRHVLSLIADDRVQMFPLSLTREDDPLPLPRTAKVTVPFFRR